MPFYALDLETTGLGKPGGDKDFILELGVAVYDDRLEYVDSHSWLVGDARARARFLTVIETVDIVRDMHTKSGLTDEWMEAYNLDLVGEAEDVQREAYFWFTERGLVPGKEPMVGSSIHFDRERFLAYEMPSLNDLFHYRNIDASSNFEYLRKTQPEWAAAAHEKANAIKRGSHRVLDDIHDTINLLRLVGGLEPVTK